MHHSLFINLSQFEYEMLFWLDREHKVAGTTVQRCIQSRGEGTCWPFRTLAYSPYLPEFVHTFFISVRAVTLSEFIWWFQYFVTYWD